MNIRLTTPGLDELAAKYRAAPRVVEQELRAALGEAAAHVRQQVASRMPVRSGRARDSLTHRVEGPAAAPVGIVESATVPYVPYLEFGTRPHVITARRARVLRFESGGRVLYRASVQHPGTRAYRMFRDGAEASRPEVQRIAARRLSIAIRRIGNGER